MYDPYCSLSQVRSFPHGGHPPPIRQGSKSEQLALILQPNSLINLIRNFVLLLKNFKATLKTEGMSRFH